MLGSDIDRDRAQVAFAGRAPAPAFRRALSQRALAPLLHRGERSCAQMREVIQNVEVWDKILERMTRSHARPAPNWPASDAQPSIACDRDRQGCPPARRLARPANCGQFRPVFRPCQPRRFRMNFVNPNPFTTRPEIDGTFGVVDLDPLARDRGRHGHPGARRQRVRRGLRDRVHAAGGRAASQRAGRRRAGDPLRRAARQAGGDLRAGVRAGRRHHRALPRQARPRPGARHRAARGLHSRHVRHLDDAAARLRHDAHRRRALARDRLRAQRLSAGRAHLRHHRHREGSVPRTLADLGGGLSAGRQGAEARHACSPIRRWPRPTSASCARRRTAATARPRSSARARPGRRASSPRRSTSSAAPRRSWTPPAAAIAACSPPTTWRSGRRPSRRRSPTTTAATRC